MPTSELEDLLAQFQQEGEAGQFTLAREKALEKLAAFLLPRPSAWASKFVQAAVLAGAASLKVKQTRVATEFLFTPTVPLAELEDAFFNPQLTVHPAVEALRQGLWSVSYHGMRPFTLAPPDSEGSLVWTGSELRTTPCRPAPEFRLAIAHRTVYDPPTLSSSEAARVISATALELAERAYVCPIPLTLDGRRLDRLQGGSLRPAALLLAEGKVPAWPVPPATFEKALKGGIVKKATLGPTLTQTGAACVLSLQVKRQGRSFEADPQMSWFHWVRDGVIIDSQTITGLDPSCVTAAVYASAQGLRTDLSGFTVTLDDEALERQRGALSALATAVKKADFTVGSDNRMASGILEVLGTGLMYIGGTSLYGGFLPGFLAVAAGVVSFRYASPTVGEELEEKFSVHLDRVKRQWPLGIP